jgi:DNA-binding GntR family transcriptional regulator
MRYRCNMTAADRAYSYAKQRILDGRFEGGDLISEGEIAEGAGMSRTPVREAFLRLESEGLLRLYPKRGALVVPVSVAEVESVLETRLLVERHAIEKVILRGIDLSEDLEASIAEQVRLADVDDTAAFVNADREFHRLFVAAAGNPTLLALHDSLRDRQSRMGIAAIARDAGRSRSILAEHRDLVAAVTARKPSDALAIIGRHLDGTLRLLLPGTALSS